MRCLPVLVVLSMVSTGAAHAQEGHGIVYKASFYASAEPQTAFDMVQRTPGFVLQQGDARRGYAGSLGNVLVDGRRPISKSQTLEEALKLIPAGQVLRIEVLSGADVSGDPSGYGVIANIVRVPSVGQGIWGAGAELANQGEAAPNGYLNWSGRWHHLTYDIGGATYALRRDLPGTYRDVDGAGALISTGEESSPRQYDEYAINGSGGGTLWGGTLSVTSKLKYSRYHEDTVRVTRPVSMAGDTSVTPYTEFYRIGDLGGQYDRDIGPWKLSLIGLLNRTHFVSSVSSTQLAAGTRFHQDIDHHAAENIVRGSLARAFGQHRLEAGYEHANNSLAAALDLTFSAGGTVYPINVPDSNSTIVEQRDDAYVSDQWQVMPDLTADLRLGYERSDLRFRGDTDKRIIYNFVKPSLSLTRKFGENQLAVRVYRDVGQINFDDFVSAASLKDAVINGGNPALAPQTQWRTELTADLHFGPRSTMSVKLYHSAITDTADLVPVSKGGQSYDAPGNIGDGQIDGATVSVHLPLDRILPRATLQMDWMAQATRVIDPLTGQRRRISNLAAQTRSLAFRQELPKHHMAWGVDYHDASDLTRFRFNETDTTKEAPNLNVYIERNTLGPYSLKATLNTDGNSPALRRRIFYTTDRTGRISHVETQKREPGMWLNLVLSRMF